MSRMDLDRNLIVMSVGQSQGITIQWSSCDICHHYRIHGPCVVRCSSSIYQESSLTILGEYFSTKILIENRCLSRGGNSNKILVGTSIAKFLIFCKNVYFLFVLSAKYSGLPLRGVGKKSVLSRESEITGIHGWDVVSENRPATTARQVPLSLTRNMSQHSILDYWLN